MKRLWSVFFAGLLTAGLWTAPSSSAENVLIRFCDAGYGDAILIRLPAGETVLIDAGRPENADRLLRELTSAGVRTIDHAILTHPHDNHFGGYPKVASAFPIKEFYTNGDNQRADEGYSGLIAQLEGAGVIPRVVRRGDAIALADPRAKMEVLYPDTLNDSVNGSALALLFTYEDISVLFLSDLEPDQQAELIALEPRLAVADVVQVPHHGGRLDVHFARFFKSRIFVVSTGRNTYGKPSLKDLERLPGRVLRTDELDGVTLVTDGKKVMVNTDEF